MNAPRPLSRWLLPVLVGLFILLSVAEVWLLTLVGSTIGVVPTLVILVLEAVIGAVLLRHEGRKSWSALVAAYQQGRIPTGELADAALVLTGGLMLILPGFITDIVGLAFLLPPTRPLVRKGIGWLVATQASRVGFDANAVKARYSPGTVAGSVVEDAPKPAQPQPRPEPDPQVIRGEIED